MRESLYADGVSRRAKWRESETRVITVTPVPRGVVRPGVAALVLGAGVLVGAHYLSWVHTARLWLLLALAGPFVVVLATRTWRWRSHKVHVTSERVVVEGGVVHHTRHSVELRDVLGVHVDQHVWERVVRRGALSLDTAAGPLFLGVVRHPAALGRLIERERGALPGDRPPLDTVFDFEDPGARGYAFDPRWPHDE